MTKWVCKDCIAKIGGCDIYTIPDIIRSPCEVCDKSNSERSLIDESDVVKIVTEIEKINQNPM